MVAKHGVPLRQRIGKGCNLAECYREGMTPKYENDRIPENLVEGSDYD
jgi:hypothetical protein